MGYTEAGIRRVENLVRTLKKRNDELEAQLQQAREELAEARRKLDTFEYGENYIKKFLDAKEKCSAMYPPEEVYAPGQLECWAEEHGYKLTIASPEVKP